MNSNKLLLILLLFATKSEARLKLVFSDEFNERSMDENKWELYNDTSHCDYLSHLNCFSSNPGNLRLIDGTLAMTTIRQKYLNKFYTTPYITTKQSFTYGRFEMRAALPGAKMLTFAIMLIPTKDGRIDILYNHQTQDLLYGLEFEQNGRNRYDLNSTTVEENLNEFNIYVLEWTQTHITWIFNGRTLGTFNATQEIGDEYNPFTNPFKLNIYSAIGGVYEGKEYFPGQVLYEKDADEWNCSLLTFDYIRIYQNVTENNVTDNQPVSVPDSSLKDLPQFKNITSSDICNKVMPLIQPKKLSWKLIFSDEFTNEIFDQDNWHIQHKSISCEENKNNTYCKTNTTRNIRLSDGAIVLQYDNDQDNFTAPLIISKRTFKYGKFEIRAALPSANNLKATLFMEPTEEHNKNNFNVWSKEGQIGIVSTDNTKDFNYGINFASNGVPKYVGGVSDRALINESLFNFHTYVMEWTETEIKWMFDNKHLNTISIQKELAENYNPFDKLFKLVISLVKVKNEFSSSEFFAGVNNEKKCPLLILDYIRVYEKTEDNLSNPIIEQNNVNSTVICEKILPMLNKSSKKDQSSFNMTAFIAISITICLLAIIASNIFLFIRMKNNQKRKAQDNQDRGIEIYDDINDFDESGVYSDPYETYNSKENEYTVPDQNQGNYYSSAYHDNSTIDATDQDNNYIRMTKIPNKNSDYTEIEPDYK